jgi:hypothetical protein
MTAEAQRRRKKQWHIGSEKIIARWLHSAPLKPLWSKSKEKVYGTEARMTHLPLNLVLQPSALAIVRAEGCFGFKATQNGDAV